MTKDFLVGVLGSPFGVKGEVKVRSYSGESAHFLKISVARLLRRGKTKALPVERVRADASGLFMKFEGIDSPEEARKLEGWEIVLAREEAAPLGKAEFYISDLVGCSLTLEGRAAAKIVSVCDGTEADFLEAETPDGRRALIPFMDRYLGKVDVEAGTIELKAGWLLE